MHALWFLVVVCLVGQRHALKVVNVIMAVMFATVILAQAAC